jgi:Peptidase S46
MKMLTSVLVGLWLLVLTAPASVAGEGFWPLSNLPFATLQQRFGFRPSSEWINHVQLASVRLAEGCSGSFVSPHGLVLSNHHCVVECLEGLSSPTHNLMAHYFYAQGREQELKCPAMEVEQLVQRTNVTATVDGATDDKSGAGYAAALRAVDSRIETGCAGAHSDEWRCEVVSLYQGGQYWLYKYRRYQDVRLVFAPSQPTSFLGGYPDNFNYPRYDYDVGIVRVYMHGRPAQTPDYFRISPKGPTAGELVFTSGNPGETERNDTMAELNTLRYPMFPSDLQYLGHYQGLLEAFAAENANNARIAQGTLFFVGNDIKGIDGESQALNDRQQFARKERDEAELRAKVAAEPGLRSKYGDAWGRIADAENKAVTMYLPESMIVGREGFSARLFDIAFTIVLGAHERTLPDTERFADYRTASLPLLEEQLFSRAPVYPGYDALRLSSSMTMLSDLLGWDAPICKTLFATASPEEVAKRAVEGTKLADPGVRQVLWKGGQTAVAASHDPMIVLAREVLPYYLRYRKIYEDEVTAPIEANTTKIARARFALFGTSIYPDATFTERLSYGVVKGWVKDSKEVAPFTTVAGLYARARGYAPLALSEAWLAARRELDPKTPVNFVSTNDIVGGNSGSPVIDHDGTLVGMIFDGNLPSLGGSFWYDEANNRAVAVDSAIILAALEHVYHAQPLVKELTSGG